MSDIDVFDLQPDEEGLVIATSDYEYDFNAKLFLWYYGRPRKFYQGANIDYLVSHNSSLVGNQTVKKPNHFVDYEIRDILRDKTLALDYYKHLFSHDNKLFGTQASDKRIEVDNETFYYTYKPIQIGTINGDFNEILSRHWYVTCMLVENNNQFILGERKFPLYRFEPLDPRCIRVHNSEEDVLMDLFQEVPYCVLSHDNDVLVGVDFGIYNVSKKKTAHCFHTAHNYMNRLVELHKYKLIREDRELFDAVKTFFKHKKITFRRNTNNRIDQDLRFNLEEHFAVHHMVSYRGNIVFATPHELYILGQREPVHRFRRRINGLAVVDKDVLKHVKRKTSVRQPKKPYIPLIIPPSEPPIREEPERIPVYAAP
ncbi:hypothetical protein KY348_00100 [Candidatus Woesearchaeota archaeon]|nr:hypothetical protein [Candidatus Woesearchaeota archaeon]